MKKLSYLIVIVLISSLVLGGCTLLSNISQVPATEQTKVKPEGLGGAQTYAWHLSADVMPVPPYGSYDIPGSDTASKLIVNQPNGNVEVAVTGVMNGLEPNTEYTVYPSDAWPTYEKWNIVGDWSLRFLFGTGVYDHDMTVTFQDNGTGAFLGTGHSTTQDPEKTWDILATSEVVVDTITLDLIYTGSGAGYTVHAIGTIDTDGTIIDGSWSSSASQSGTWSSYSGNATKKTVGSGWPGLFNNLETFTFMTDADGAGSWHFNLKNEDFSVPGSYGLSVWINKGGSTILISENFEVVVD
jgi:hypothetical protein